MRDDIKVKGYTTVWGVSQKWKATPQYEGCHKSERLYHSMRGDTKVKGYTYERYSTSTLKIFIISKTESVNLVMLLKCAL